MNVIVVLADTLTRDKLSPYHHGEGPYGHIQTPNLDRLARQYVTFNNHWVNSVPSVPIRRDLWSGRIEFPWRSWGPLESFDSNWASASRETGARTALITDHANLFDIGAGNYHHHFDDYEFLGGHNGKGSAGDGTVARAMLAAAEWLDHRGPGPFFLVVDEADVTGLNADEEGKISTIDQGLGEIMNRLDRHGLWDDSMLIVTSGHGELMDGYVQGSVGAGSSFPLLFRTLLLVHYPGSPARGESMDTLSCMVDLHATVVSALGLPVDPNGHGVSLTPALEGLVSEIRTNVLFGCWGRGFCLTDGSVVLCKAPKEDGPLYQYGTNLGERWEGLRSEPFDRYVDAEMGPFLPHTNRSVYRVPSDGMTYGRPGTDADVLFSLDKDPECQSNLFESRLGLRRQHLDNLIAAMRKIAVPNEHFVRLGLEEALREATDEDLEYV